MTGVGKQETSKVLFEIILFISSIYGTNGVSGPVITASSKYFFRGETFSLNCTVHTQKELPLKWICPSATRDCKAWPYVRIGTDVMSWITVVNATAEDEGNYTCESNSKKISFRKEYLDRPKLKIEMARNARPPKNGKIVIKKTMNLTKLSLPMSVDAYPEPITYFLRDGQNISIPSPRHTVQKKNTGDIVLTITNLTWTDIATYTFVAVNSFGTKNLTFDLRLYAAPVASLTSTVPLKKTINETLQLSCNIKSGDEKSPEIKWTFVAENGEEMVLDESNKNISMYQVQSFIVLQVQKSGKIICSGKNNWGTSNSTCNINAYEINNGFGIKDGLRWYPEKDDVTLECIASKYDYKNVTWEHRNNNVSYYENGLSYVAVLKINSIRLSQSGNYTCVGIGSEEKTASVYVDVEANRKPRIADPNPEKIKTSLSQLVQLFCQADAVPPPQITWYKDNVKIENGTGGLEVMERLNQTVLTSMIAMTFINETQQGEYKCIAVNREGYDTKIVTLMIPGDLSLYIAIFGVTLFTFMAIVIYLTWKVKKEKQLRKELAALGLLYFKEGALKSINPDLNVDEQADLLPYDERFEFPAEKLTLDKQLGAGAFGVVYKAEAPGILNAEETTIVAVKTVKKNADNMYIKALASELKIMVHLGKHVNIVNLLGACTKNIAKRELMVIVEYCRFGNIHNYLIKHREVFVNQLATDSKNEKFGHDNSAYSYSVDSSMHTGCTSFSYNQTTDQTFLNSASSSRPVGKASEGYVQQPEWRTNYENDYQTTAPRPLFSRDLLAWAFQIARGMEYLAGRKVLHGDLAARNVVLADDNVVKICDFGLARSIYKNDEYKKKSDSLLPLKWLAIECLTDRIFSTQSDVWSFGIVLWELFSLAKTPYPSQLEPSDLYQFLISGNRLDKPTYADDRLYAVMQKCWQEKPKQRPSFTELQEELGSFLEEADRNRYIHLNSSYEHQNAKTTGKDFLAMMNSPDYNNLVTPSPCGYGNFFPQSPKSLQDHEGYLLSTGNSNFTFDTQNIHKTPVRLIDDATELTPMLNLDNVPEAGSHSDQDDGHTPHQNFPRIEEEVEEVKDEEELDEVFDIKSNNTRNIDNTNAVSNLTYVTIDDIGLSPATKSQNTYVNTIPKILVK